MSLDELRTAMRAVEDGGDADAHRVAVHCALGSKYLAVGSPRTLGIVGLVPWLQEISDAHATVFERLRLRQSAVGANDVEATVACDVVCVPSQAVIDPRWIADATHLNVVDEGEGVSPEVAQLLSRQTCTYYDYSAQGPSHGTLRQVIRGEVSGRVGEELTVLTFAAR